MRRVLYMGTSVNGCCADEAGVLQWSPEQWESFGRLIKRYKNVITGRRAYETFSERNIFTNLKDIRVVIVSNSLVLPAENPHVVVASINEALSQIAVREETHALFAGGVALNSAALSQDAIDEIIWDVEPNLVRKGMAALQPLLVQHPLELISLRKIGRGTIQLQYATPRGKG